jgi:SIR2-like domain
LTVDEHHYGMVADLFRDGVVTPFLGAGANLCDRPENTEWSPGTFLPSGAELARTLAARSRYPDPSESNLLLISQYVDALLGERRLYGYLHEVLDADYPPNTLHRLLVKVAQLLEKRGLPRQLIVTTNYDDLIERAFDAESVPYDLVWYEAKQGKQRGRFIHRPHGGEALAIDHPNKYTAVALEERTAILKLHGAFDRADPTRDSYVITEDDYIAYLSEGDVGAQIPVALRARMADSHFLFLGYSLRDWNLRVILNRIWGAQQLSLVSWAIQREPELASDVEKKLWRARGDVDLLYIELKDYVGNLAAELFGTNGAP